MIEYMPNFNYIRVIKHKDETMLLNECTLSSLIIKNEIYDIIKNISSLSDCNEIAKSFCLNDQTFFQELEKAFEKTSLFLKPEKKIPHIKRITYIITDYCNLFCKHCCYSAKLIPSLNFDNNLDKKLKILDQIILLKPEAITITGGEPLTIKNFDEIINKLKSSNISSKTLQTNATLITVDNVNHLADCFDAFDISLDGTTPDETDFIRGNGVYQKVMNAISLLKKNNVNKISLSCAMDIEDISKRSRFENLCASLNVKPIIRQMSGVGRAAKNFKQTRDRNDKYFLDMTGEYCSCSAGINEITVNSKGEVYPCINFHEYKYSMGNIFDTDITHRLGWDTKNPWYKTFSEYVSTGRKECLDCEMNLFCWHCPFQLKTFLDLHNTNTLVSFCQAKKEALYRRFWNE